MNNIILNDRVKVVVNERGYKFQGIVVAIDGDMLEVHVPVYYGDRNPIVVKARKDDVELDIKDAEILEKRRQQDLRK